MSIIRYSRTMIFYWSIQTSLFLLRWKYTICTPLVVTPIKIIGVNNYRKYRIEIDKTWKSQLQNMLTYEQITETGCDGSGICTAIFASHLQQLQLATYTSPFPTTPLLLHCLHAYFKQLPTSLWFLLHYMENIFIILYCVFIQNYFFMNCTLAIWIVACA